MEIFEEKPLVQKKTLLKMPMEGKKPKENIYSISCFGN